MNAPTAAPAVSAGRSLQSRLALVGVALAVLVVAGLEWWDLRNVGATVRQLNAESVNGLNRLGELQYHTQEARRAVLYALTTKNPNRQLDYVDRSRMADDSVDAILREDRVLAAMAGKDGGSDAFSPVWRDYLQVRDDVIGGILEGRGQEALDLDLEKGVPAFDRVRDALAALKSEYRARAQERVAAVERAFDRSLMRMVVVFAAITTLVAGALRMLQATRLLEISRESERALNLVNQDLLRKNQELEEAEHALQEATRAAEAASLAKSSFLANMSHELRTPLNAVIGYSEILLEDAEERQDRPAVDDLNRIRGCGQHLLTLINQVLDISKVEAGRMEFERLECDVVALAHEVASSVAPLVAKNANRFESQIDLACPPIQSDPTRIRQVLFNLISNAAKFTKNGVIALRLRRSVREGLAIVEFEVADSGIGIEPEYLARMFEAFTQSDSSTSRKYGGTGLGLALSRHLARMMGGDITVASTVGKGSTFTFWVPAAPPATSGGVAA